MSVVKEFDFKLATARDIPPAWYELVLRPSLFQDHMNNLHTSCGHVEPSAVLLIATFLEKALCIPGQAPLGEGGVAPEEQKKTTLIDSALFIASFLKWDISSLENKLPAAVLYALYASLASKFPVNSSFDDIPLDVFCAQTLYSLWIIHCLSLSAPSSLSAPPSSFRGYQWEGACSSLEVIKIMIKDEMDKAVRFLEQVLTVTQRDFTLPCDSLELPSLGDAQSSATVRLPLSLIPIPYKDIHAQIRFDLGKLYFVNDLYAKSLEHFQECSALFKPHLHIDHNRLRGFLTACELVTDTQSDSLTDRLTSFESYRHGNAKEAVQNLPSPSALLPAAYRAGLQKEIFDWSEMVAIENKSKRRKLSECGRGLTLSMQLCIWDVIQGTMEGRGISPTSLQILNEHKYNEKFVDLLLASIDKVLSKTKSMGVVSNHLVLFLQTTYSNDILWNMCTAEYPLVTNITTDISKIRSLLFSPNHISSALKPSATLFNNQYSRLIPVLASSTPSSLMTAVSDLFQQTPTSDHIPIANTLQGDSKDYANVRQMNTPLLCAQYNGLLRKGIILSERKDYKSAVEFYSLALKIVNTSSSSPNSLRLVPILMEQNLKMKVLATACNMKKTKVKEMYPTLLNDVKNHYGNSIKNPVSFDPLQVTLSGVFLLNMQEYSVLSRFDHPSLYERICPKLALAVQHMKDGQDLRRRTRDLFEIVAGVFTMSRGGGADNNNNSMFQRKCLEMIAINLKDQLCLSYLMSALVRLWNLVKKPENELSCEYTANWPTTVGNINSIKERQVMRLLELTLTNAIRRHPSHYYWLIMKGDISFGTSRCNNALLWYLEAGTRDSDFFGRPVSNTIWDQQVYHRIIKCCCAIELYSQAIVLCQFLAPLDYSFVFSLLKDHSVKVLEFVFDYLWDMTIIEYLIYLLARQGDIAKQATAIQTAGRPELNTNNGRDTLVQVIDTRKRTFLRIFYKTLTITNDNFQSLKY